MIYNHLGIPTYWIIHGSLLHENPGEMLGMYKRWHVECFDSLTEQIGHNNWKWDMITQAEFETYQAFGIREFAVE